jgi:hypothetical protein
MHFNVIIPVFIAAFKLCNFYENCNCCAACRRVWQCLYKNRHDYKQVCVGIYSSYLKLSNYLHIDWLFTIA